MSGVPLRRAGGPRSDVLPGDRVYYRHPKHGPQAGEVVAVGQDGFSCAHGRGEGEPLDGVPWGDFLGHKVRKQRQIVLVDQGEDGMIGRDKDTGTVHFIRDGGGQRPEPMAKAHPAVEAALGVDVGEAVRLSMLELAAAQVEAAAVQAAAIDRLAQAVAVQTAMVQALVVALQAPATGVSDARSVLQGDSAPGGSAEGPIL